MEHLDSTTLENWYANRAKPVPALLHRLAVIAPDDAPGLAALRQRLAQRGPQSLNCDHFAAGFDGTGNVGLAGAFEQIRQRHETDPYDIVLLLEGRPEALGIAESNGLIPEQVSRMPVPVWTAIGEDDANTELGDVANRVFSNPGALIAALPLAGLQPQASAVYPAAEPAQQPATAAVVSLAAARKDVTPRHLPTLPVMHAALAPERAGAHPLVLCAAGAVIVASVTAVAAMLGWLPSRVQLEANMSARPAATATSLPATRPTATVAGGAPTAPAPAGMSNTIDTAPATPPAVSPVEPVADPAAPSPSAPPAPQSSGLDQGTALAAIGAAGLIAAAPRAKTATAAREKRARRTSRRTPETPFAQAQAPRQVGSTEVPVIDFVGTKSRQQVMAELMESRRAANRQAANGNYFPAPGRPSARR